MGQRTAPMTPRRGSAIAVRIVVAQPVARLVAPFGGAIEPLVHTPEAVQPARVGRIGVKTNTALRNDRAHARPLPHVGGDFGAGHGSAFGRSSGCRARSYLG